VALSARERLQLILLNLGLLGAGAAVAVDVGKPGPMLGFVMMASLFSFLFYRRKTRREKELAAAVKKAITTDTDGLPEAYAARVTRLEERRKQILAAAEQNRNFDGGLMAAEVTELEQLVQGFRDLAAACARWERHLATTDFDELEAELRKHETDAERAIDPEQRELARRNLRVLMSRKEQLAHIRKKITHAQGQLDLLENSFRLIADEVLAMQDPGEIKAKLDELLAGVEAVRETTRDTGQRAAVRLQAQRND
jgi:hypothetical protein